MDVTDLFDRVKKTPEPSDAGKRVADTLTARITFQPWSPGKFMVFMLADGKSDGVLYDTREDAAKHTLHAEHAMILIVRPEPMKPEEADELIGIHRRLHAAGMRMTDQ